MPGILEHVNVTVSDPIATANMLCALFDWQIRWQGPSIYGGQSVHVGGADSYIALYSGKQSNNPTDNSYNTAGGLNHIGIVVDDLDAAEARVVAAGFTPNSHADYEPGKRFYFDAHDKIEIEVVSYAKAS